MHFFTLTISVAALSVIFPFSCVHVQRDHDFGTTDLKGDSSLDTFFGRVYEILKSQIFNLSALIWSYALEFTCKSLPENKLLVFLEWDVYNWYFYERSNFLKKKKHCLFLYSWTWSIYWFDWFIFCSRYLAGTEEGHIHKCSCSYNEQYLESYLGHTVRNRW